MASDGDPRVLFVINIALSLLFASIIIRGLAFINTLTFSWTTVALLAAVLFFLTEIVTR